VPKAWRYGNTKREGQAMVVVVIRQCTLLFDKLEEMFREMCHDRGRQGNRPSHVDVGTMIKYFEDHNNAYIPQAIRNYLQVEAKYPGRTAWERNRDELRKKHKNYPW
jgi:hypothetical protein